MGDWLCGMSSEARFAATSYPSLEETRDATLVPGEHLWIAWAPTVRPDQPMISCRWCGIVRRADGANKPCRGKVRVTLR